MLFSDSKNLQSDRSPSEDFFLAAQEFQNLIQPDFIGADCRRGHARIARSISVSVQPLDADFWSDGDVFWVVSRDISLKGMGLISYDPILHDFVRVGLLSEGASVVGRIRHNTSIGNAYPLYLVGLEFLNE